MYRLQLTNPIYLKVSDTEKRASENSLIYIEGKGFNQNIHDYVNNLIYSHVIFIYMMDSSYA